MNEGSMMAAVGRYYGTEPAAVTTPKRTRVQANNPKQAAIYQAAVRNNVEVIQRALENGIDIDAKYEDQMTPMMGAAVSASRAPFTHPPQYSKSPPLAFLVFTFMCLLPPPNTTNIQTFFVRPRRMETEKWWKFSRTVVKWT